MSTQFEPGPELGLVDTEFLSLLEPALRLLNRATESFKWGALVRDTTRGWWMASGEITECGSRGYPGHAISTIKLAKPTVERGFDSRLKHPYQVPLGERSSDSIHIELVET